MTSLPPPVASGPPPTTRLGVFLTARFVAMVAQQIQSLAVAYHIYAITHQPLALGMVGLAQFVPMLLLTLPAGDWADRFPRRWILTVAGGLQILCAALFLWFIIEGTEAVWPFYVTLAIFGTARAISAPSLQSAVPLLVPKERLPKAVALSSTAFQTAIIVGPAAGGGIYVLGAPVAFAVCLVLFAVVTAIYFRLSLRIIPRADTAVSSFDRMFAGIVYLRYNPVIVGAISLDLFAVLLGSATALLPVFATDILHVGATGMGLMQSAPAVGATAIAIYLTRYPVARNAGVTMFIGVAVFGVSIIVFGLSRNFLLSLGALVVLGASDMISVYVRSTFIQLATPDAMRGRVSAVNMLFINASNELGDFESGFMAAWLTAVPAVVVGGIGTILVAGLWLVLFPGLRRIDKLTDIEPLNVFSAPPREVPSSSGAPPPSSA